MSFDTHAYHAEKIHMPNYLASHGILDSVLWQHTSNGLEVANQSDLSPFIGILVGRVTPFRLKCGPAGNHINKNVSPLSKAKYQFHLTHPADHELGADYQAGIAVLEALESQVGNLHEFKNMIIEDMTGKMVRMVKNVFEKRVAVIPDSPHGKGEEGASKMDNETHNWPIPDEFMDELDEIKYSYQADPLPIYHDGHLVEPFHAQEIINGAIIEVHFGILHWHIGSFDSFQANVDKIQILKLGYGHHTSNYKRAHPEHDSEVSEPQTKKSRHDSATCS